MVVDEERGENKSLERVAIDDICNDQVLRHGKI